MKTLDLYGKFLASADRQSWIDTTRITSFNIQKRGALENDVKAALGASAKALSFVWGVYCNFEKNSELVGLFSTEDDAREKTEILLITVSGKSQGGAQPQDSRKMAAPARLSLPPIVG